MKHTLARSFRGSLLLMTPVATELRLRLATLYLERKAKRLIENSSKLLAAGASQQQLQVLVAEIDRIGIMVAARFAVSADALALRSDSLRLLKSLSSAQAKPAVVGPFVVVAR